MAKIKEKGSQTSGFMPQVVPSAESAHNLHCLLREDGICVLTFDRPDSSANFFDYATLEELRRELDFIAGSREVKGVVLVSAKPTIFIAGVDLRRMTENTSPSEIKELLTFGQAQINRLTQLSIPTVAAIHGAAMGGGFEIALACDYRLASPDSVTKIGLPETNIGLLPAWGGATRLPRLIGLPKALDFILPGKTVPARYALKLGLVDELVPAERFIRAAVQKIQQGKSHRPSHWLVNNPLMVALFAPVQRVRLLRKTRGHYPAVMKAFEVMTRGITKSVSSSLALEREGILELARTDACHNLIRIFFMRERAKKRVVEDSAPRLEPKQVTRAVVIGAGVMGAGIAQWMSARGLPVILRDVNTEQMAKGMAGIAKLYQDGVRHHVFTRREARDGFDRIYPSPMEVPLRHVDLVVEAAVENLELKKKIFQRLDEVTTEETILATNTSALPVSDLAAATRYPQRVLGLHFFNPVHRMQLVEIVAGRQTAPEALSRAVRFVQRIGKLPVVVKDSPGFLVNRILMPYLVEAGTLFEHGASLEHLDEAMLDFGMPMGPMRLLDEVGLDVALHVAQTLAANFGARLQVPAVLTRMVEAGLLGRKSRGGFYVYDAAKKSWPNPQVMSYVQSRTADDLTPKELQERMFFLMLNEAARCLEEKIVAMPEDIDFAMIMGTGFAPFRGGPLRYADSLGLEKIVGAMEILEDCGATQYAPCPLLRRMAADGTKFYPTP
ncbi:MAG TPA: 3-hydroxyacyl-CoA dehydrogenase NAD-binding domain-containing protein [Candidatus Acidoferrum sp.]|nr:3-hydroxyacyl-CoA dehydrogenase NAD-binding domain-containing protein [Candidatus Acidoferrum sp.]